MTAPIVSPLESTVENHIDSTSRLVRKVDLAISLLIIFSLITGGLFLAVIADHWLLKEGLTMTLRLGIFAALFTAAGLYIYWKVVPLWLYPINPVYTADLIERDTPVFKNSLINWLLLRQERLARADLPENKINDRMFDGVVRTAAAKVQTVPAGHAVDLQRVIWAGAVLAILLVLFVAYAALSPKNPFASLARVMLPFSGIERPQAAQFRNVQPGDTTALQGETLTISAEVVSQSADTVYLVFSTDDGQAVQQRIPMSLPEGKIAFETQFPPGKQGLERGFNSSVDYWIAQGESRSKQYRIEVLPAASVEIVSLSYKFPDYTGTPPETIEHGGDIRTLEGTEVTVAVRSTLPLQDIDLVFDDNPANRVRMMVSNTQKTEAKGTFTLKTSPPRKSFAFRATDIHGNASRRSGIYQIEVIPDQPPRVQWADTAANLSNVAQMDLPLNKTLQLPIQAEDPDFALRYLVFKTDAPGKRIPDVPLISSPSAGPTAHRGQIKKTATFSPEEKRLAVGDTVEIFVEAKDTKLPDANVSETRRIKINVVDPEVQKEDPKQEREKEGEGESKQDNPKQEGKDEHGDKNPNPDDPSKGQPGEEQPSEGQPNEGQGNQEQPEKQDPGEGQEQNGGEKGEGQQDPNAPKKEQDKENESNGSNESKGDGQQDPNAPKQDQQGATEGGNEQQGGQPDNSNADNGKNEPADGGKQGSEGQPDGGEQEGRDNAAENSSGGDQQGKGEGKGGEKTEGKQEQERNSSVNPETQDSDAMERIVDQMKDEGLFPGVNPFLRNDNQRMRNDSLDPNSPNRSNQGNDPTNPKESNQPSQGDTQKQPDKQNPDQQPSDQQSPDKQPPDKPSEGNNSESGQPEGDTQSETNEGSPQNGEQDKEAQGNEQQQQQQGDSGESQSGEGGESGYSEQQSPSGESQPGQPGQEGGAPGQQQGNPQDNTAQGNNSGVPGGTGGGGGAEIKTAVDDPNLEYANKVTNLVLDYLESQLQDKPSDELLNRLGWSEDQLRQFYDKWQKMSQDSKLPPQREDGKDAWKEALQSIGLLPNPQRHLLQNSRTRVRDTTRPTETQRYEPPAALKGRARTYNEGIGK